MKRKAQPLLSEDGQHALDQYAQVLQRLEDLLPITMRNNLSDLRQSITWCECSWRDAQEDRSFIPLGIAPSLLMRYRDYLQKTLDLKPSMVNRTLMSLKRYLAWTRKTHLIQSGPASPIKFVSKEASPPRHLDNDEEDALIAAVNATGTLRDQAIIIFLLHTGLLAQELCTLICQQIHLGKRNGTLRIMGKRKKVCEVPLNTTAGSILNQDLFPSEKTH